MTSTHKRFVRVCVVLRSSGKWTCPSAALLHMRNTKVSSRVSDIRDLCGLISSPLWENTLLTKRRYELRNLLSKRPPESSHSCDENAFNIVAVLVSRNTSLARPRTWLVKAKDFCSRPRPRPWPSRPRPRTWLSRPRPRTQNLPLRTRQGQGPRPRTTTLGTSTVIYVWHECRPVLDADILKTSYKCSQCSQWGSGAEPFSWGSRGKFPLS